MRRLLLLAVSLVLIAAACGDDGGGLSLGGGGGDEPQGQPAPEGTVEGAVAIAASGDRQHVEGPVDYPQRPPVGGDHNGVWANCRFYSEPVPDENVVHSLEHGAVWAAYSPDLGEDELQILRAQADNATHFIATPYEGLGSALVLTAWERQLELDSATDPRFGQFIDTYMQGPTTPEQGAACTGGAG